MVVGAVARNIASASLRQKPSERTTTDVDIAITIDGWNEFQLLAEQLESAGGSNHKFLVLGTEVDVVAYGNIESTERTIVWPNDHKMNVLGFQEAYEHAQKALLPNGLTVKFRTIAAQALLKVIAWTDRSMETTKDAIDLHSLIDWYIEDNTDKVYEDPMDTLVQYEYDPDLACSHRIGIEMAGLLGDDGQAKLREIISNELLMERLANDMTGLFDRQHKRLTAIRSGIFT